MLSDRTTEAKSIIVMLNDPEVLLDGMAVLKPDHFAAQESRSVFKIMAEIHREGKPVTVLTVAEAARHLPGFALRQIMDTTMASRAEADFLFGRLEDMRRARIAHEAMRQAMETLETEPGADAIDHTAEKLFSLGMTSSQREQIVDAKEMAVRAIAHISERRDKSKRAERVINTSLPKLNRVTGGFEAGDLVIISGPTGSGKSAFAQNLLRDIAVTQRIPSLYTNSEMTEAQMALRWAAMLTADPEITHSRLRAGDITDAEQDAVMAGLDRLYNSKFACLTIPDLRIDKVLTILRRYAAKTKLRAAAIDYIGRTDAISAKDAAAEWQILLQAARRLKTAAVELGLVVFMVAQVKADGRLQQASYMENEADLHLRIEPMTEDEIAKRRTRLEPWNVRLHIAKGRNCAKGWTLLNFNGEKLTFTGES